MFTGIIAGTGTVKKIERGESSARFSIAGGGIGKDVAIGDSITVNGACLTVVAKGRGDLVFDAVYETLQKTALGALAIDDKVNLERSLRADGRFDGHIVQGHVDGIGTIASIREVDNSYFIYITTLSSLMRYIVRKGSVAVDGISLTVVEADDKTFSVSIIPYTWDNTNLSGRRAGDQVNIETDIIGKYVEKLITGDYPRSDSGLRPLNPNRDESLASILGTATLERE
jgi:riboflavin synthase